MPRPEPLTKDEAMRLLNACSKKYPTGVRDRALLGVMYRAGLRCAEALGLRPQDIDADGTVRVLNGKGDKYRVVALDEFGMTLMNAWLEMRIPYMAPPEGAGVFCTFKGSTMCSQNVRLMIKRRQKKAQITKRVHCHGLRHTFAMEMAEEGVPMPVIQQALGHSDLATTAKYLQYVAPVHVIKAMKERKM